MRVSRTHDTRHLISQRYRDLGLETLWKSLDEVDVLGRPGGRDRTAYGHTGCVNALSWSHNGELLVSSGDDTRLLVWKHDPSFDQAFPPRSLDSRPNSINLSCVSAIRTGHTDNVFAAQLLVPDSSLVATCARDRQVRVFDLERAGGTSTRGKPGSGYGEAGNEARLHLLKCHTRQVKRIVTEQSPSTFLTVAGDHTVRQHDLRTPHMCPRCPQPLVKVPHALNGLALSPLTPWYFVVAGESKYGHLFDRRMTGRNLREERGMDGEDSDELVTCVARFGRSKEKEDADRGPHVTGARMARSNGHEVYQYSIYDTPSTPKKSSIIPPNSDQIPEQSDSESSDSSDDEAAAALENVVAEPDGDDDSGSHSDEMSEDSDAGSPASRTKYSGLDRPVIQPRKEYRGAGNVQTVKDVNFLGPNDEFVTSGSDDGNWFMWSKKSGELLGIWEGDGSVVNVVEGHPFLPIVAVSGIDNTIKIFEPTSGLKKSSRIINARQIVEENESANETESFALDRSGVLAALQVLRAAGRLPEIEGEPECPTQ
ncbi:WD40 repeat-like protein [Ceratobasidium sp. AG-I]|nr:WD40 repeat-like protein [Ceratobasidium sp. AG-I]